MKCGSVEAFQVVVVCQVTPPGVQDPAQRLPRQLRDDALGEQVVAQLGQRPGREAGQAALGGGRQGDQTDPLSDLVTDPSRASPAPFWVQCVEPRSLNAWITSRT